MSTLNRIRNALREEIKKPLRVGDHVTHPDHPGKVFVIHFTPSTKGDGSAKIVHMHPKLPNDISWEDEQAHRRSPKNMIRVNDTSRLTKV
jgi:hypothetical protein